MSALSEQMRDYAGTCAVVIDPNPKRPRCSILDAAATEIEGLETLLRDAKDALFDNNWERVAVRHLVARIDAAIGSAPPKGNS